MEKYFTKEQIERLADAVEYFNTAVNANYKRASTVTLNNLVADIYLEATGKVLNRNWGCGTCVLNAYKEAGRLYYDSVKHYEEENAVEPNGTVQTETEPANAKKTPKKTVTKNKKPNGTTRGNKK